MSKSKPSHSSQVGDSLHSGRCVLLTKPLTADLLISFLLPQNGYPSYRGKAKGPGHAIGKDEKESTILC